MKTTFITVRKSLSWAIRRLQDIRDEVTEEAPGRFKVQIKEGRDLEPIRTMGTGDKVGGFRQTSPIVLTIVVEDNALKGKELGNKPCK